MDDAIRTEAEQARISKEASILLIKICELFEPYCGKTHATVKVTTQELVVFISTDNIPAGEMGSDEKFYRHSVQATEDGIIVTPVGIPPDETIN